MNTVEKEYPNELKLSKEQIVSWEYVEEENVPFKIITFKSKEKESYMVAFMNSILTEKKFETKKEALEWIEKGSWEMICAMMYEIAKRVVDIHEADKMINTNKTEEK